MTPTLRTLVPSYCLLASALLGGACARPARVATPTAIGVPALPTPLERLGADVLAAIRAPGVQRAVWGIAVHSLDRDERLVDINSAALLVPASAAKIVSIATAADAVGWDYRFETRLLASRGGRLQAAQATADRRGRLHQPAQATTDRRGRLHQPAQATADRRGRLHQPAQATTDRRGRLQAARNAQNENDPSAPLQADPPGVLVGDLLVVGSGDPSIGGRGGSDLAVFVDALKARGIRRIEGRVIGDDDALEEPRPQLAWAWDDLGYTSGAIFGALNLAENRMAVRITPAAAPGLPTTLEVEPHATSRPLANRTVTTAPGQMQLLWPEQRPGEPFLTIAGFIPAGAAPARLNVSVGNPTFWFATVLRNALLQAGIEVTGEAFDIDDVVPRPDPASAEELFVHASPPLSAIAQPMLKDSINLYAEAALRLNTLPGAFPTNDAALEGLNTRLAAWGVPADAQQLIDGSGLSRRNVMAPEALLTILRRMHDPAGTSPFVTGLPVAGVDGSLAGRMRGTAAEGNVRAKTGTMSNIRSLAGYVTTQDGERLAFVVMVNNFEGTGAAANQALDAIAIRLASFTRAAPAPPPSSLPGSR